MSVFQCAVWTYCIIPAVLALLSYAYVCFVCQVFGCTYMHKAKPNYIQQKCQLVKDIKVGQLDSPVATNVKMIFSSSATVTSIP